MKTNQQWGYLAPELEVIEMSVECRFAASDPMLENPEENPDQPW